TSSATLGLGLALSTFRLLNLRLRLGHSFSLRLLLCTLHGTFSLRSLPFFLTAIDTLRLLHRLLLWRSLFLFLTTIYPLGFDRSLDRLDRSFHGLRGSSTVPALISDLELLPLAAIGHCL